MIPEPKRIPVRFYGHLGKRFGKRFDLAVRTPAQAIRHLCGVLPGFKAYLQEHSAPGFHIFVGTDSLGEDQLDYPASERECIKIVPAVAGAGGSKGLFQVVLGAALVALSVWYPVIGTWWAAPTLGPIGMSLALGGIAQMLAPSPSMNKADDPGHSFNGSDNVIAQGQTIPVTYGGPILVGSLVLSVGTSADTEFPTGSGGGPFGGVGSAWVQMSDAGDVSAWHNGGDGSAVPWVWNVDPA